MYATLEDWIQHEAIPFSLNLKSVEKAADKIMVSLNAEVTLLGFGEALHGGEEILTLRNCLFQRLVRTHGFSAIALESGFPQAAIINEYIAGRSPASFYEVQDTGFSHGFGRLEANRELVEWLKDYNSAKEDQRKIRFYGIDMPLLPVGGQAGPAQVLPFVLDYLTALDEESGQKFRSHFELFLGQPSDWENSLLWRDPAHSEERLATANALRIEIENLTTELRVHRPELVVKSGDDKFLLALQNLFVARQLLNYMAALAEAPNDQLIEKLFGIRDALIAENIAYMFSREQGRGKLLVFAHNTHLQKGLLKVQAGPKVYSSWSAGAHLAQIFGSRYAVIGSALGESAANGITLAEKNSLEAKLITTSGDGRFIPTNSGRDLPVEELERFPVRSGSNKNPTYMKPLDRQAFTDFDAWAVLNSATYSQGALPLL